MTIRMGLRLQSEGGRFEDIPERWSVRSHVDGVFNPNVDLVAGFTPAKMGCACLCIPSYVGWSTIVRRRIMIMHSPCETCVSLSQEQTVESEILLHDARRLLNSGHLDPELREFTRQAVAKMRQDDKLLDKLRTGRDREVLRLEGETESLWVMINDLQKKGRGPSQPNFVHRPKADAQSHRDPTPLKFLFVHSTDN